MVRKSPENLKQTKAVDTDAVGDAAEAGIESAVKQAAEALVSDIISRNHIETAVHEGDTFKDIYPPLQQKIDSAPEVIEHPEVRAAVLEEAVKRSLLASNGEYQEKKKEQALQEERLQLYRASEEKLPEYLEFLNSGFFSSLGAAIGELDPAIQRDLWNNPEFKNIENLYDVDHSKGRIIGLKSNDALPTVTEMERQMTSTQKPWDHLGNFAFALTALKRLKGLSYLEYKDSAANIFGGNIEGIARDLLPEEALTEGGADDAGAKQRSAFLERVETSAEKQAKEFATYGALKEEVRLQQVPNAKSELGQNTNTLEKLRAKLAQLAAVSDTEFRVENGRVINVAWEQAKQREQENIAAAEGRRDALQAEKDALGPRPEGILNGKKREAWEATNGRLTRGITQETMLVEQLEDSLQAIQEDWTTNLNLSPGIVQRFEGATVSGSGFSEAVRGELHTLQLQHEHLAQAVTASEEKARQIDLLERVKLQTR